MASRESNNDRQRVDVHGPTALGDAVAAARRYALDQGLDPRDEARLSIIVEELITNLCEHGACVPDREISLELARRPDSIQLAIEDNGTPFDPRTVPKDADMPARGGGAGLRLVGTWSTIVSYASRDGRNRLELIMPLTGS